VIEEESEVQVPGGKPQGPVLSARERTKRDGRTHEAVRLELRNGRNQAKHERGAVEEASAKSATDAG
jgi:hypothetical protein